MLMPQVVMFQVAVSQVAMFQVAIFQVMRLNDKKTRQPNRHLYKDSLCDEPFTAIGSTPDTAPRRGWS